MREDLKLIRLIEELEANSWPAHTQQALGAWRMRATLNVTKRANSVYTNGPMPEGGAWLDIVEEFYRRRSIPPCFYMSAASPAELDGILAARGYQRIFEGYTMTGSCRTALERLAETDRFAAEFAEEASSEWIDDFMRLEEFPPERYEGYVRIFSAIGPQKSFVRLRENGEVAALGTVVAERGWAGLCNIVVGAEHRGKGAAKALLRSLAGWALQIGAEQLYFQVLKDNLPALSLYRKLGFTPLFEHYYRIADQ